MSSLRVSVIFIVRQTRQPQRSERRLCHPKRGEENLDGKGVTGVQMTSKCPVRAL
jgi:hypothetical protein